MIKNRFFEVLDKMNQNDTANGKRTLAVSFNMIECKNVNNGGLVTMAIDMQALYDVFDEKARLCLCVINKEAYDKEDKQ